MAGSAWGAYRGVMKQILLSMNRRTGLIAGVAFCSLLVGCVTETRERRVRVYEDSRSSAPTVVVEDDYVYYPNYEVYYSNRRHQYVYLDGRTWVTRPAPPRIGIDVLLASPSVHVDFHDTPERHHADVVRRYPRNWRGQERRDDRHDDHRRDRDDDRRDDNRRHD